METCFCNNFNVRKQQNICKSQVKCRKVFHWYFPLTYIQVGSEHQTFYCQMVQHVINAIKYQNKNGQFRLFSIWFLNGTQIGDQKCQIFGPVFRWHYKIRTFTNPSNAWLVWYSNPHCTSRILKRLYFL